MGEGLKVATTNYVRVGQLERISEIFHSVAGLNIEKSGGVAGGGGK